MCTAWGTARGKITLVINGMGYGFRKKSRCLQNGVVLSIGCDPTAKRRQCCWMSKELTLHINGKTYEFSIGRKLGQIPEPETLLKRCERLGLTGTKLSLGGACGCCAV